MFLALLGTLLLVPGSVFAQYTVQPMVLDHTVEPRDSVTSPLTVRNTSDRIVRLYATVNAITLDSDGGIESFTRRNASDNRQTITSWLSVDRGRIEIAPGEEREVSVGIQMHPHAEPGVYHAFVGFASGRNRDAAEKKVHAGQAPGSIVRIEVAENRTSYLQLETFRTDRFVTDPAESVFSYTLENPGDVPHTPRGEVIIYDTRGREIGAVPVNPDGASIAPGESKVFTSELPETGHLGRHRAFLSLTYGDGQLASIQDTIFFTHIPLVPLILIFVAVLLFACGIAYLIHRRYGAHDDTDEEDDAVLVFHRPGERRPSTHHDIDLSKQPDHDHDRT